jgi:hypothetical protein
MLFGACIYGCECGDCHLDFYVTAGATQERRWSWQKLRFFDNGARAAAAKRHGDLIAISDADPEVSGPSHSLGFAARRMNESGDAQLASDPFDRLLIA